MINKNKKLSQTSEHTYNVVRIQSDQPFNWYERDDIVDHIYSHISKIKDSSNTTIEHHGM